MSLLSLFIVQIKKSSKHDVYMNIKNPCHGRPCCVWIFWQQLLFPTTILTRFVHCQDFSTKPNYYCQMVISCKYHNLWHTIHHNKPFLHDREMSFLLESWSDLFKMLRKMFKIMPNSYFIKQIEYYVYVCGFCFCFFVKYSQ